MGCILKLTSCSTCECIRHASTTNRTRTNTIYRNPSEINPNALKEEFVQVAQETEREVLFSHGNRPDATSYDSMNQLVYKETK